MHWPLLHLNLFCPHPCPGHFHPFKMHWPLGQANPSFFTFTYPLTASQLAPHTSVVSSLPSSHDLIPLHLRPFQMHWPLLHLNWFRPHLYLLHAALMCNKRAITRRETLEWGAIISDFKKGAFSQNEPYASSQVNERTKTERFLCSYIVLLPYLKGSFLSSPCDCFEAKTQQNLI